MQYEAKTHLYCGFGVSIAQSLSKRLHMSSFKLDKEKSTSISTFQKTFDLYMLYAPVLLAPSSVIRQHTVMIKSTKSGTTTHGSESQS